MFDVNPDAAKYYLKDIERQVAAARQPRGVPGQPARSTPSDRRSGRLPAVCGRITARLLASAVRGAMGLLSGRSLRPRLPL
jgi:hypothetical protein